MGMSQYTKLYRSILTSTIWQESKDTRLVWITMLALSEVDGTVEGALPGLAKEAGVTIPECQAALAVLMAPDPYSRTKTHEGRRIIEIDGGWKVLNREKYRDKKDSRAEYYRKYRASRNSCAQQNATQEEEEAKEEEKKEEEKKNKKRKRKTVFVPPTLEDVQKYLLENPKYSHVDASTFIEHYALAEPPWTDRDGRPVRSWKQKIISVWSKRNDRPKPAAIPSGNSFTEQKSKYGKVIND